MWLFRSRAAVSSSPDPVGDICRSLAERPWEWEAGLTDDEMSPSLSHPSGVELTWAYSYGSLGHEVSLANGTESVYVRVPARDARRLYRAIQANAAARVARPVYRFTDSARLLAQSVLAGELDAAYALADEIIESCTRPAKDRADVV